MSINNNTMLALLKQQEQEKQDLAASAFKAWQSVQETEEQLLAPYSGSYEHAPQTVKETYDKHREEYFNEWGSDGTLTKYMDEKHIKQREFVAKREQILSDIRTSQQRNKEKGNER